MKKLSLLLISFFWMIVANAGIPVWQFTPLTDTNISISSTETTIVQYLITNNSFKPHTLAMEAIPGITQITTGPGICSNPFYLPTMGSSCVLSLSVNGGQIRNPHIGGPIVCQVGSQLMCYRPSPANTLRVQTGAEVKFTVGGSISGLVGSVQLLNNGTDPLVLTSNGSFTFSQSLANGAPYLVTVGSQPVDQECTVTDDSGTIDNANVTNVTVVCISL